MNSDIQIFMERPFPEADRPGDWRSPYSRDKARIIHGSALRRLQGKTQVMGAGEGDFHRTRLTHSLEVNQIGLGLFEGIKKRKNIAIPESLKPFMKNGHPVISAACYGHDLGHPPFGHGGEKALHSQMVQSGGFEANAQTIRLLSKLEKYHPNQGINPTRRVLLSLLKYPVNFNTYPQSTQQKLKPPKCYYACESDTLAWCLEPFSKNDVEIFTTIRKTDNDTYKPEHMSFDASIMECADDIAYCTHDLEDIIARRLITKEVLNDKVKDFFSTNKHVKGIHQKDFLKLFEDSYMRKQTIGKIVNLLMTTTEIDIYDCFEHPLMRYRLKISDRYHGFVKFLKTDITYNLVVEKPEIQMLEKKGQRIITALYAEFKDSPERLIPQWNNMNSKDTTERKICDYIAGMTDTFAAKIYHRLFTPGIGSSRDEL